MRMFRRFLAGVLWCCPRWGLLAVAAALAGPVSAQSSREYDLKAVFLYNFASFVDWPQEARPGPEQSFVIGILGQDPFGRALEEVVAGEKVHGAPLQVRRCQTVAEARQCHILFIAASEAPRLATILQELRGRPVLTVADMPRFLETGGIIAFSTDGRVQLHVNASTARLAGLTISSKLLRVAKVIDTAPPP